MESAVYLSTFERRSPNYLVDHEIKQSVFDVKMMGFTKLFSFIVPGSAVSSQTSGL